MPQIQVDQRLVRNAHFARQPLEVGDRRVVQPNRHLPLETPCIWIALRLREIVALPHFTHLFTYSCLSRLSAFRAEIIHGSIAVTDHQKPDGGAEAEQYEAILPVRVARVRASGHSRLRRRSRPLRTRPRASAGSRDSSAHPTRTGVPSPADCKGVVTRQLGPVPAHRVRLRRGMSQVVPDQGVGACR